MKQFIGLIVFSFFISCNQSSETRDVHHPTRPSDIPATTCSGMQIDWNWDKQRAYKDGRLWVHRDSTGCVLAIVWKKD